MAWNYSEQDYRESKQTIPAGKHRVRISAIVPKVSKKGSLMYEIALDVSGLPFRLRDYLVFMEDNAKMTNAKIGAICHSFGVSPVGLNPETVPAGWVGAVGAADVVLDEEERPKVRYYIDKEKQTDLPPWKEPERKLGSGPNDQNMFSTPPIPQVAPPPSVGTHVPPINEDDLPFSLDSL